MKVSLAQQAQELLGHCELVIITERVDDVVLLIGQMVQMGFPEVLDRHIPRHGTHRGLSWGWTAVMWLAYSVTEGDHQQVAMATYIQGMHHTLSHLTAQVITPLDVSADRMSHLLTHVSKPAYWHQVAHDVNARSLAVYSLSADVIRCDATTVSGEHEVTAGGLLQCGHSKNDPPRPQIKVMLGSLDPVGRPRAPDGLSGERADDGLYLPMLERLRTGLQTTGLLFVGACKMSALATRGYLAKHHDGYVSPLPLTGANALKTHGLTPQTFPKRRFLGRVASFRHSGTGTPLTVGFGMTAAANPIRVVISISEWQPGKVVPSLETFI